MEPRVLAWDKARLGLDSSGLAPRGGDGNGLVLGEAWMGLVRGRSGRGGSWTGPDCRGLAWDAARTGMHGLGWSGRRKAWLGTWRGK